MHSRIWLSCVSLLFLPALMQAQEGDAKATTEKGGTILEGHVYSNPLLGMIITLSGSWEFFEQDKYSTPEQKERLKRDMDRAKATCQGPLCGEADIKDSLQWTVEGRPVRGVFVTAFKLSPEYQNRKRHPLVWFARTMLASSTNAGWVSESELTPVRLDGKPAYRLVMHNARTPTAKGFAYVADSNGFVFMLVATALSGAEQLQAEMEGMKLEPAQR